MPKWEVEWSSRGTAVVEADDLAEAEQLVSEGLTHFDTLQFEEFEVDETECVDTQEIDG